MCCSASHCLHSDGSQRQGSPDVEASRGQPPGTGNEEGLGMALGNTWRKSQHGLRPGLGTTALDPLANGAWLVWGQGKSICAKQDLGVRPLGRVGDSWTGATCPSELCFCTPGKP